MINEKNTSFVPETQIESDKSDGIKKSQDNQQTVNIEDIHTESCLNLTSRKITIQADKNNDNNLSYSLCEIKNIIEDNLEKLAKEVNYVISDVLRKYVDSTIEFKIDRDMQADLQKKYSTHYKHISVDQQDITAELLSILENLKKNILTEKGEVKIKQNIKKYVLVNNEINEIASETSNKKDIVGEIIKLVPQYKYLKEQVEVIFNSLSSVIKKNIKEISIANSMDSKRTLRPPTNHVIINQLFANSSPFYEELSVILKKTTNNKKMSLIETQTKQKKAIEDPDNRIETDICGFLQPCTGSMDDILIKIVENMLSFVRSLDGLFNYALDSGR